jgi:hypothetical protein
MVEFLDWGARYNPEGGLKILVDRIKQSKKKAIRELQDKLKNERLTKFIDNKA